MKKPYIKKIGEVSGITVWVVDGYYIRQRMDINFNNFGQHYKFDYIPKNEFWLDRQAPRSHSGQARKSEEKYFIEHLLAEHKLMAEDKDYNDALDEGDRVEQELRDQDKIIKKLKEVFKTQPEKVYKKIRQKLLGGYSNKIIKTYIVNSNLIRSLFYIDWVAGGHDKVYKFVPPNEVWLDNDIVSKEKRFVLLHELHERFFMSQGWDYEKAHASALKVEHHAHEHPDELKKMIKEELARQTN
jgi:hypothetical protein